MSNSMSEKILDMAVVLPYLDELLDGVVHGKRRLSLAQAIVGACHSPRAGVNSVGRSMAAVLGKSPKHCVKQFDRLLSNEALQVEEIFPAYVTRVVGSRKEIVVALDWTDYDDQGQTVLALSLVCEHGRATPLVWKTYEKRSLKDRRNQYEDEVLWAAANAIPGDVRVTLLADRGFGDVKLYGLLRDRLGWDFVIRFREGIKVAGPGQELVEARSHVPKNGTARKITEARLTLAEDPIDAVVCVKKSGMKQAWCLATTLGDRPAEEVVRLYGLRFRIEETFRDEKDDRFGMGLSEVRLGSPGRRDRMLLVLAFARLFLTTLGRAGEELDLDRKLRANTRHSKRSHALFTQGREYARGVGVTAAVLPCLLACFLSLLSGLPFATQTLGLL